VKGRGDITILRRLSNDMSYFYNDILQNTRQKEFEYTKEVIRIRKSKKNRQHNGQSKKDKRTNNHLQNTTQNTQDRVIKQDNNTFTSSIIFHSDYVQILTSNSCQTTARKFEIDICAPTAKISV
jgi:hypothetical protein